MELTEEQRVVLTGLQEKLTVASYEVADAMDTGYMSDAKSAVFALGQKEAWAELSPEVQSELAHYSAATWHAIISGGDLYQRAGSALAHLGEFERYVEGLK